MNKQWKWTLAVMVVAALAVTATQAENSLSGSADAGEVESEDTSVAPHHNLLDVRVATDQGGPTMVVLDADGRLEFDSFVLDQPDRVVVDLEGVISLLDQYRFVVDEGAVVQVRAAQHQLEPIPVTRVVFDLEQPMEYRIDRSGSMLVVAFDATEAVPLLASAAEAAEPVEAPEPVQAPEPVANYAIDAGTKDATLTPVEIAAPAEPVASVDAIVEEMSARMEPADEPVVVPAEEAAETPAEAVEPTAPVTPPTPVAAAPLARSVDPSAIEELLEETPSFAAPQTGDDADVTAATFDSRRIITESVTYRGKRISLNLVDADIKQVFRLFHEISGLNFVLDPAVGGRVTIVLDQVPWDQALDIILKNNGLDKVLENNVLRIATTEKLAQEAASRKRLKEAEEMEVDPITLTRALSYGKAKDIEKILRGQGMRTSQGGILSQRGTVIVDERTNTVIVSDIPKKIEAIDELITVLDAETPQVMIEARIVETSKNFSRDLGVVWDIAAVSDASRGTSTGLSFPHNASARYALNLPGEGGASNLGFSFGNIVDSFTLDLALNALETEGRGRIISAPKIATQNNERAEIEQGVRIPVTNTTATEIQVEFVSASLLLAVTPQITAEGTIVLDVIVENNSPDFVNTAGGIPSIRTQRAQTKVLISDGGTTVIGGIFVVNEGDSEVGVPWFRKVPVFGWLFRNQSIQKENRELLIFITPKIVKLG